MSFNLVSNQFSQQEVPHPVYPGIYSNIAKIIYFFFLQSEFDKIRNGFYLGALIDSCFNIFHLTHQKQDPSMFIFSLRNELLWHTIESILKPYHKKQPHSIQKLKFNYDLSANKPILAATDLVQFRYKNGSKEKNIQLLQKYDPYGKLIFT